MRDVTRILQALEEGDVRAAHQILPQVYKELRRVAAHKMALESANHTLQPTALVHEAWLRLPKPGELAKFQNYDHFVATAAEAMRRILVESARRKKRIKHGGALERVDRDEIEVMTIHGNGWRCVLDPIDRIFHFTLVETTDDNIWQLRI